MTPSEVCEYKRILVISLLRRVYEKQKIEENSSFTNILSSSYQYKETNFGIRLYAF